MDSKILTPFLHKSNAICFWITFTCVPREYPTKNHNCKCLCHWEWGFSLPQNRVKIGSIDTLHFPRLLAMALIHQPHTLHLQSFLFIAHNQSTHEIYANSHEPNTFYLYTKYIHCKIYIFQTIFTTWSYGRDASNTYGLRITIRGPVVYTLTNELPNSA